MGETNQPPDLLRDARLLILRALQRSRAHGYGASEHLAAERQEREQLTRAIHNVLNAS
jgi:hypothetical protein